MIDIHTHPVQIGELFERNPELERTVHDVFGLYIKPQPLATYLGHLDEAGLEQGVILPIDCTTAHGCTIVSNEEIAWLCEQSDRFIGFASVDPRDEAAPDKLRHAVREYGLRGLKLDPSLQLFDVGDRDRAYPVYQTAVELGIPVLMHAGMSWAPKGPASMAHPLALEQVIHDFPDLTLIIAHFGWPWVNEAVMLAIKHRNVHLDTSVLFSGTPPESLHHVVVNMIGREVLDRSLHSQVLFGSNYPRVDPKRAAHAVRALELRPKLEQRIFRDNARRVLGLEGKA